MESIYRNLGRIRTIVACLIIAVGSFGYGIFAVFAPVSQSAVTVSLLFGFLSITAGIGCISLMLHKQAMQKATKGTPCRKLQSEVLQKIVSLIEINEDLQRTTTRSLGVMNRSIIKNHDYTRAVDETLKVLMDRNNTFLTETNDLITNLRSETVRSISVTNRSINSSSKVLNEQILEIKSEISSLKKKSATEENQISDWRSETQRSIAVTNRSILSLRDSSQEITRNVAEELKEFLEALEVRQLILMQEMYRSLNIPEEIDVPINSENGN